MSWWRQAACRGHETLGPDAWFDLHQGFPGFDGVNAIRVCQKCPVMQECYDDAASNGPRNVIVGGGWFDNKGIFHFPTNVAAMAKWRRRAQREAEKKIKSEEKV